jgi:hypothetical protein
MKVKGRTSKEVEGGGEDRKEQNYILYSIQCTNKNTRAKLQGTIISC